MKTKALSSIVALLFLYGMVAAQDYYIRILGKAFLQDKPDIWNHNVIEIAPNNSVLHVSGEQDGWMKIERQGLVLWLRANNMGYVRIADSPQAQARSQRPAVDNCCSIGWDCGTDQKKWEDGYNAYKHGLCETTVDNCCQAGWDCQTDQEWVDGYNAFQSGICFISSDLEESQNQITGTMREIEVHAKELESRLISTHPVSGPIPAGVDNCCFLNRQCDSQEDWEYGYALFEYDLCHVPNIDGNIRITGSDAFVSTTRQALRLLLGRSPKWYRYTQQGLRGVTEIPMGGNSGIYVTERIYRSWPNFRTNLVGEALVIRVAGLLVHEACHVNRYVASLEHSGYVGEKACLIEQIHAMEAVDPFDRAVGSQRFTLANIDDPEYQWWRDR